jgi:hypothetical protein
LQPLNGTRTHPLSAHAWAELAEIARQPVPCSSVNPGVMNRLEREGLIERFMHASPFRVHRGRKIEHLMITAAGRTRLAVGR